MLLIIMLAELAVKLPDRRNLCEWYIAELDFVTFYCLVPKDCIVYYLLKINYDIVQY